MLGYLVTSDPQVCWHWQVRASPVPSNVTIFEQMDGGAHGALAPQPGASLGMPAIPTTASPLDAGGYR